MYNSKKGKDSRKNNFSSSHDESQYKVSKSTRKSKQ
jgi:hypothetical protein